MEHYITIESHAALIHPNKEGRKEGGKERGREGKKEGREEGSKQVFYLMTHSTHLITVICLRPKKEENALFNDALNTFSYGYMASA